MSILLALTLIVLFGFLAAIPQDPSYHDFAPSTLQSSNIPNTLNVLTNIPFAIVGLYGLIFCLRFRET
ncbi:MAG: ceramidase domain-containing protein, partial [Methylococcales bacterium]